MSVNKYLPHVLLLPEDDANRQLANGFHLDEVLSTRQLQVLAVAGGWREVLDRFKSHHVSQMEKWEHRFMVLLIDFDEDSNRLEDAKSFIPEHLSDRVLILGVWTEPERLRVDLGLSVVGQFGFYTGCSLAFGVLAGGFR